MTPTISVRNFELTEAIRQYVEEKVASLGKYHIDIIMVSVEMDKNTHHRKGDVFHVRWNIEIPKDFIHVEATKDDLYAAVDEVRDEADREMRHYKSKFSAKLRRVRIIRRGLKSLFWREEKKDQ